MMTTSTTTTTKPKPQAPAGKAKANVKAASTMEDESLLERPKRPLSAYNLFFKDARVKLLEHRPVRPQGVPRRGHGKMGFAEMARAISQQWKSIDAQTKSLYERQGNNEKVLYQERLAEWKLAVKKPKKSRKHKAKRATTVPNNNNIKPATSISPRSNNNSPRSKKQPEDDCCSSAIVIAEDAPIGATDQKQAIPLPATTPAATPPSQSPQPVPCASVTHDDASKKNTTAVPAVENINKELLHAPLPLSCRRGSPSPPLGTPTFKKSRVTNPNDPEALPPTPRITSFSRGAHEMSYSVIPSVEDAPPERSKFCSQGEHFLPQGRVGAMVSVDKSCVAPPRHSSSASFSLASSYASFPFSCFGPEHAEAAISSGRAAPRTEADVRLPGPEEYHSPVSSTRTIKVHTMHDCWEGLQEEEERHALDALYYESCHVPCPVPLSSSSTAAMRMMRPITSTQQRHKNKHTNHEGGDTQKPPVSSGRGGCSPVVVDGLYVGMESLAQQLDDDSINFFINLFHPNTTTQHP
ncbi:hypothetical protein ACA910_004699 [Epithemia clementina (nom. ined.)]